MNTSAPAVSPLPSWLSLGWILRFDALTCTVLGLVLMIAHASLSTLFGLPSSLLMVAGAVLLPCAVLMRIAGADPEQRRGLVWVIIAGNLAWFVASLLVAFAWFEPTAPGLAFVLLQAAAVAVVTVVEVLGLSRLGA